VRRIGIEGLWCQTEWDGGTVLLDGMVRRECGVRRNGTVGISCEI
jgi:hypothetical protein